MWRGTGSPTAPALVVVVVVLRTVLFIPSRLSTASERLSAACSRLSKSAVRSAVSASSAATFGVKTTVPRNSFSVPLGMENSPGAQNLSLSSPKISVHQ